MVLVALICTPYIVCVLLFSSLFAILFLSWFFPFPNEQFHTKQPFDLQSVLE